MTARPLFRALTFALAAFLLTSVCFAHKPGLSRLDAKVTGDQVSVDLTLALGELLAMEPSIDADKSGSLDEKELRGAEAKASQVFTSRIKVERGGAACAGKLTSLTNEENDGVAVHSTYVCSSSATPVRIKLGLFDDLSSGHRCLATLTGGTEVTEAVLSREHDSAEFAVAGDTGSSGKPQESGRWAGFGAMVLLGIEHILTGWDHLLFLFGLVLVGGTWRATLTVVTAFTLAHSITLGMAALGVWSPSPRVVEPAIALSIAYVGVENFLISDVAKRWRITFPFGLVHGFGFAGALSEIRIPQDKIPATLFGFNLGVEIGQIGVLVLVLPLLVLLRKREWFRTKGVRALSAVIVVVGVALFIQRLREG